MKLAQHLYSELHRRGVDHAFGIPGDFALSLWAALEDSPIQGVVTAHEPAAGFAADAYARVRGLSLALVTYGVGGLNMVNPTAQAYAEKSPMVVLSGSPGIRERSSNPLLHHKVKTFDTQRRVYAEVTRGAFLLDNPYTADMQIQEALQLVDDYKQPVYIEIPRDLTFCDIPPHHVEPPIRTTDRGALLEAVNETVQMIVNGDRPAILACVEMHRFGLQRELVRLAEITGMPVASTMLGKGVFPEDHPQYLGIYVGGVGNKAVEKYIEGSDCLLMLGAYMSDFNLGLFTADLRPENAVLATAERIRVRHHQFTGFSLQEFMGELVASPRLGRRQFAFAREETPASVPALNRLESEPITIAALLEALNRYLGPEHIVITDVGDCLFAALDLQTRHASGFLCPAYYLSMGFAVPGAIGAQIADRSTRPVVLIGDGAFQMMGMELLTMKRYGLNPLIVLLNNGVYSTLKFMNPESEYLDIPTADYAGLAEVLGGTGCSVRTVGDLAAGLRGAEGLERVCLLDVHLAPSDTSSVLQGFAQANRDKIGVSA